MGDEEVVKPSSLAPVWWTLGVLAVALLALLIGTRIADSRADDRRTDEYFCTMPGTGPLDRGPNTGLTCAEILG